MRTRTAILWLVLGAGVFFGIDAARYALAPRALGESFDGVARIAIAALGIAGAIANAAALAGELRAWRGGRLEVPPAGLFRALVYALALGMAFQLALLQPYTSRRLRIALGLALALFGVAAALRRRLAPIAASRPVRALDLALMNVCVVALLGEASLRALAWARPSPVLTLGDATSPVLLAANRLVPGTVRMGFRANAGGYYDEEPRPNAPGVLDVAMIGDSFTVGNVPHRWHFGTVCERLLGGAARLQSYGVSATGPPEYLHVLETEVLPAKPDLVLASLYLGNDIRGAATASIATRLFDRRFIMICEVPRRLARLARERREGTAAGGGAGAEAQGGGAGGEVMTEEELRRAYPWVDDPDLEPPLLSRERFLEIETRHALDGCGPRPASLEPLLEKLERMRRACGEIPLIVVLFPTEPQVEDPLWAEIVARAGPAGAALDRDQPQRLLGRALAEHKFAAIDLLPALRAVPKRPDGWRKLYLLQDTHVNVRGNDVAAREIAEALRPYLKR